MDQDIKNQSVREVIPEDFIVDGNLIVEGSITFKEKFDAIGEIKLSFDQNDQTYVMPCDVKLNEFTVQVLDRIIPGQGPIIEYPMKDLPVSNIPEGDSLNTGNGLILTNTQGNVISSGPWNVIPADTVPGLNPPPDAAGVVIKCGVDEPNFLPGFGGPGNTEPPFNSTVSVMSITLDNNITQGDRLMFDLNLGYSTEPNFDFLEVTINGVLVDVFSGSGLNQDNPYQTASISGLLLSEEDVLEIRYNKDFVWYSGFDVIYFYIQNLQSVPQPGLSSLAVTRNGVPLDRDPPIPGLDFALITNFDSLEPGQENTVRYRPSFGPDITENGIVGFPISPNDTMFKTGDVITFKYDTTVITTYAIELIMSLERVEEQYVPITHHAPLTTATLGYQNKQLTKFSQIDGWYESDSPAFGVVYVQDRGTGILVDSYSLVTASKNFIHNSSLPYINNQEFWAKVGINRYRNPQFNIGDFIFEPTTGNIVADMNDPVNIAIAGSFFSAVFYRRIGNPDSKLWEYQHRLQDYDAIFNNPKPFFDFVVDYYCTTKLSGKFTSRGESISDYLPININEETYNFKLSNYKRSFGALNKRGYQDLACKLSTTGIKREYGVKRFIYWPQNYVLTNPLSSKKGKCIVKVHHPHHGLKSGDIVNFKNAVDVGCISAAELNGDHRIKVCNSSNYIIRVDSSNKRNFRNKGGDIIITPVSSKNQKKMEWVVNQNNHQLLGFISDFNDSESDYTKLIPGEEVYMEGSGTRLDGIPLVLDIQGYHMGPRPSRDFVPDLQYDNWSFYSIRLPLVITSENNILQGNFEGAPLKIPEGNYYMGSIFDYINEHVSDLNFFFGGFGRAGYVVGTGKIPDETSINSPSHPTKPSTLFGPKGLNFGFMFEGEDVKVANFDNIIIVENNDVANMRIYQYYGHTPLTNHEVETLLNNMDKIKISSVHGPITNNMSYRNFSACLSEIMIAATTEVHGIVGPIYRGAEFGGMEIYPSFDLLNHLWQDVTLDPDIVYESATNLSLYSGDPRLRAFDSRIVGTGHPAELATYYSIPGASRRFRVPFSSEGNSEWLTWPTDKITIKSGTKVNFGGRINDIGNNRIDIPVVNYLDTPTWLVSRPVPILVSTVNIGKVLPPARGSLGTIKHLIFFGLVVTDTGSDTSVERTEIILTSTDPGGSTSLLGATPDNVEGGYFALYYGTGESDGYAFWYNVDNSTPIPPDLPPELTPVSININSFSTTFSILISTRNTINSLPEFEARDINDVNKPLGATDYEFDPYDTHVTNEFVISRAPPDCIDYVKGYRAEKSGRGAIEFDVLVNIDLVGGALLPPNLSKISNTEWIGLPGEFIVADPKDADPHNPGNPLLNSGDVKDRIVLIETIGTDPTEGVDNSDNFKVAMDKAEEAGAIGVVFIPTPVPSANITTNDIIANYVISTTFRDNNIPSIILQNIEEFELLTQKIPQYTINNTTGFSGNINSGYNSAIVGGVFDSPENGSYNIGISSDKNVKRALAGLGLDVPDPTPKYGYFRYRSTVWTSNGIPSRWSWISGSQATQTSISITAIAVARMLEWFNKEKVSGIIGDMRQARGGGNNFWTMLANLSGDDREFNNLDIYSTQNVDPNGILPVRTSANFIRWGEEKGVTNSFPRTYDRACFPSDFRKLIPQGFPENGFFNGSLESNPGPKKIIQFTDATNISGTQLDYTIMKGASMNTETFDGYYGDKTNMIGYGCYYRPFSTSGSFTSYINWYGRNRRGSEPLMNPPMYAIDRWESVRAGYVIGSKPVEIPPTPENPYLTTGGETRALDQDFSKLHQPQLRWNMNANIFFKDIGFTIQNSNPRLINVVNRQCGKSKQANPKRTNFLIKTVRYGSENVTQCTLIDVTGSRPCELKCKYFVLYDGSQGIAFWYSVNGSKKPSSVDKYAKSYMIKLDKHDKDVEIGQKTSKIIDGSQEFYSFSGTVDPAKGMGGEFKIANVPYLNECYPDVNYCDPFTLRDSTLENTFKLLTLPIEELKEHYYKNDGFGDVRPNCIHLCKK